jgi:hypothetical protein
MKNTIYNVLLLTALVNVQQTVAVSGQMSPISRVVELLQGLAAKVEADGKMEEDLFETYVCWYKTVIKAKEASNAAAKDRIESLEAYIADIEAGRIEFSSERTDLEAQIKKLHEEIEQAEDIRDKEHEDYLAAKDEMEKAIAALEEAVKTLDEATFVQEHKGSMLSFRREVSKFEGEQHAESAAALKRAIELGKNYLSKGDAAFLERLLSGEVPEVDWKKLNRKATFKMKYKARSTKILKMMQDMLQTFQDNLADATAKEEEAKATFDKLMKSKNAELDTAQQALTDMSAEGGARDLNKQEAQQELDDLKKQVEDDTKFMADTEEHHAMKLEEWKKRKELRTGEIGAINEAIHVLNSDESRDTFKKSFKSQGYLLLQKSTVSKRHLEKASAVLRQAGLAARDSRLTALAIRAKGFGDQQDSINKVIEAIDKMIKTLKDEEAEDLKSKEECEKTRMEQTKDARTFSLEVDDASDAISREKAKIAEWKAEIAEKEAEIKKNEEDLDAATKARADEKAEFETNKSDDEAAAGLIEKAMDVLKSFYDENFSLLQGAKQPPVVEAGKAPPPPPPTFEGDYGGAQGESKGIQMILQMILDDVKDDIKKSEEAEKAAVEAFEKLKADLEAAIKDANEAIADFEKKVAESETEIEDQTSAKQDSKKNLDSTLKEIASQEPGCNFMTINFATRTVNRKMEIDGLLKAKTILEGGAFTAPEDPNREIKPGDSL